MGIPGIVHDRTLDCPQLSGHGCTDYVKSKSSFDSHFDRSLKCSAYFFDVTHGCLFNHALADVRSTGAGIQCLYGSNIKHGNTCYHHLPAYFTGGLGLLWNSFVGVVIDWM